MNKFFSWNKKSQNVWQMHVFKSREVVKERCSLGEHFLGGSWDLLVFESIHVGQVPCFAERCWCDPLWSSRVLDKTMSLSDLSDPEKNISAYILMYIYCISSPHVWTKILRMRGVQLISFHHVLIFPQLRRLPSNWRKPWVLRCVATISTTTPFQVPLFFVSNVSSLSGCIYKVHQTMQSLLQVDKLQSLYIYIYTNKYMNIKIYKYRYKDIFIYNTSYMPISFFVDAVFPTLLHLHLQRWPPFARGTSWLQWFQGCHGDDFQSWCGPGIGYQVQRGATVKPADSKRGSFFHPFAKTEKKTTALKSSGFWNLQDWFLLLSFIITVMLQNALNHIEPTVTDVSFDTSVLLSRLNPFSTLPCYGIEYWPKDAKLIQAHQISRDQFTLWLFSCRLEDCPTQLHRDYIKLL